MDLLLVKKLRRFYGLKQIELAKLASVSQQAISSYENGTRKPSKKVQKKLKDILYNYGLSESEKKLFEEALRIKDKDGWDE